MSLEYAKGKDTSTMPENLVAAINVRMRLSSISVFQLWTSRLNVKLQVQAQHLIKLWETSDCRY